MSRWVWGPLMLRGVPAGDGRLGAGLNLLSVLPSPGDLSYRGVRALSCPASHKDPKPPEYPPKPPGRWWGQTQGVGCCCEHKDASGTA